uniref:Carboxylic ester hydrolase n=1 Tax=Mycena chlorophos TaxID=658473 RepID=A0ABQ0MCN6_MYCCL|nr:predicted protein [Mycena chlorophos]
MKLSSSLLPLVLASCAFAAGPIVDLGKAGKYEGFIDATYNVSTFLGIPFAAPPLGNLRWQPPTAPAQNSSVQQVTTQPPVCPQGSFGTNATANPLLVRRDISPPQSEDCLYLNVYSPSLTPKKLLPTLVWIHGGGYFVGGVPFYNGTELILESNREVVVVMMQYRLGLFGFLAGEQIHQHGVANAGLLDQQFALRWVQENVAKFGGDPKHVTIWGESAGAGSVFQHIVANGGRTEPQLFHAAITSSTAVEAQYPYNHWIPQTFFNEVSKQAGCANATNLDCLRAVDSDTLSTLNLNIDVASFYGSIAFLPVIDGSFIAENPLAQVAKGKVNGEIYLGVTNSDESVIFVDSSLPSYDVAQYTRNMLPALSVAQSEEVAKVYAGVGGSPLEQIYTLLTESIFVCPSHYILDAFPGKSYKGQFAIAPALHEDDLVYYFPSFPGLSPGIPKFNNTQFIDAFNTGFLSFAVNYNPNDKIKETIAPNWPLWSAQSREIMVFNQTQGADPQPAVGLQKVDEAMLQRCEFWRQLLVETCQ